MKRIATLILCSLILVFGAKSVQAAWTTTYHSPQVNLEDVFFLASNSSIGYAVGANTTVFKTTDGGAVWKLVPLGIDGFSADFNTVWFIDQNNGFIAGENGKCIKTTNAGAGWSEIDLQTGGTSINEMAFGSGTKGAMVGDNGLVKYTNDGGLNWLDGSNVTTSDLNAVHFYTGNSGFAVGNNGIVLQTHSFGSNWSKLLLSFDIVDYNGVSVALDQNVVVCGDGGTIITSSDLGNNWAEQNSGVSVDLYSVAATPDGSRFFVSGDNGTVLKATNINTYIPNDVNSNDDFRSIDMATDNIGFTVGNNSSISRTMDAGDGLSTTISISTPDDNTDWIRGSTQTIVWSSSNVSDFVISYSTDCGVTFTEIVQLSGVNSYDWEVPDLISENCKIKIADSNNPAYFALSGGFFTISSPNIAVLSPNGGERWQMGTTKDVLWSTEGTIATVDLHYSYDNGDNWHLINSSVNATLGHYEWTVPDEPSAQYLLRVRNTENHDDYDISDKPFAVPGVKLTSFDSGSSYLYGTMQEITWNSLLVNNLKIMFSSDNGSNWQVIEENYPATSGSYEWIIPRTPSEECLVKLIDPENSIYNDQSKEMFTISGLVLSSPIGGETWISGTSNLITWQSTEIENVMLEYTPDSGETWITIISNTDASVGSYNWEVPKTLGYKCRVRISDVDTPEIRDISDEFFTISGTGIFVVSPNGGELFNVGDSVKIQWASASVNNINIDYSTNAGKTWNNIAENVDKDAANNIWIIPDDTSLVTPSTECLIRISDADNENIFDTSDEYFRIQNLNTHYRTPVSWDYISHTGSNSVIILPNGINPKIDGDPIELNDAIGVFYNRNGILYCAGFAQWNNTNLSITVWGDDPQTEIKEGFNINEQYTLKVWDAQEGREVFVDVEYSSGFSYFTVDGISVISKFDNHKALKIHLQQGWSMISSNIIPKDTDIDIVMNQVIDNMEFMKNEEGEVYYPKEAINSIENWDIELGYQIYMNYKDSLNISGVKAVPSIHAKSLKALQWYIISYLPQNSMPIEVALDYIDTCVVMVKNTAGEVYYPDYNINEIGNMMPTEGYKIIVDCDTTLKYPDSAVTKFNKSENLDKTQSNEKLQYIDFERMRTGNTAVVVLKSNELQKGDEIAAYTQDGTTCGGAIFNGTEAVIIIQGDNAQTATKEGALDRERIFFKKYNQDGETALRSVSSKNIITGNNINNMIYFEDAILETEVIIDKLNSVIEAQDNIKVSPQPASSSLTIEAGFSIDKIALVNLKGDVLQFNKFKGVNYIVDIDINHIQSGTYMLMIHSFDRTISKKIIINK